MKKSVLFLCTGNSCRSQMAEGLLRHLNDSGYDVYSAGTKPSNVNPKAIKAMAEIGIDISSQASKSTEIFFDKPFDVVITVCDSAKEACPVFRGAARKIHWSLMDPANAKGNEEAVLSVFRSIRDKIRENIEKEFCS